MTRRLPVLLALGLTALAAPSIARAQVGYPPTESPFQDLRGRQGIAVAPALLVPGGDPAGIGPRNGPMLTVRYELLLTGPLWFTSRVGYAPSLERTVKDPEAEPGQRVVGNDTDPLMLLDAGLAFNLTGNKSWRRLTPRLTGNLGVVSTFNGTYDLGGYRFGTKFVMSYGLGVRYVTGSKWELNADATHLFWKMDYPDLYGGDGTASDDSILRGGRLAPWQGNLLLSLGVTRYFFR